MGFFIILIVSLWHTVETIISKHSDDILWISQKKRNVIPLALVLKSISATTKNYKIDSGVGERFIKTAHTPKYTLDLPYSWFSANTWTYILHFSHRIKLSYSVLY